MPALLCADALLDGEVVAEGVDGRDHAGPVADQVGPAPRGGHLAVLDQVALDHPEHELAGDRVDLAAPQRLGVQASRGLADDLLGVVAAGQHVGVGHARDRHVGVGLAAAVPGRRQAERPGPSKPVWTTPSRAATTWTTKRVRIRSSRVENPSELAIRTCWWTSP